MNFWQQNKAKGYTCPYCNRFNDTVETPFEPGAKPRPGDYTLCVACRKVARFNDNLKLEKINQDILRSNSLMSELIDVVDDANTAGEAIQTIHKRYGKNIVDP